MKLLRRGTWSGKLNLPPNTCIPTSEKMTIKRKRRRRRQAMDRTEFSKEAMRLAKDGQFLRITN